MDTLKDRQIDKWTDREMYRQTNGEMDGWTNKAMSVVYDIPFK
jgi:hypothetical protein